MPYKKKPLPLHVSRARIEQERANVVIRTQRRIALLRATENSKEYDDDDDTDPVTVHSHACLSIFCFVVLLVIINLLFLQWLYYEVRESK